MNQTITDQRLADLPALGQSLADGIFCGVITTPDGKHQAVVLLAEVPAERMTWKAALKWADSVGGQLPTRPVAAMLYANARPQFDGDWYWTADELDGSYAWDQLFDNGYQLHDHKSYEGRARAVRLIQLSA